MRFDFLYDAAAGCSRSATGWPMPTVPPASTRLLRSACLRGAARELRGDREGRRPAASLVPSRTPGDQRQWPRDPDVVGRHDVRVPDAAAADAQLSGDAAGSELPCGVRRQVEYARRRGMPWGVSESAYAFTDRAGHYQYRAFGVPGLGLKRGLVDDLVIAPYATALASLVDPAAAAQNFERLAREGLDGGTAFTKPSIAGREPRGGQRKSDTATGPRSCGPSLRTTRACRSWRSPT